MIAPADRDALNIALNEATWIGVTTDALKHKVAVLMDVLSLPVDGPMAAESPIIITLHGVCRIAVSLRDGRWDDTAAQALPLALDDLDGAVRSFGGCPVYGWEFIDPSDDSWSHWRDRTSLDVLVDAGPAAHVLELFQENALGDRHLDLRVWFESISFRTPTDEAISPAEFGIAGRRWWDGLYAGDPRTKGRGIAPLGGG